MQFVCINTISFNSVLYVCIDAFCKKISSISIITTTNTYLSTALCLETKILELHSLNLVFRYLLVVYRISVYFIAPPQLLWGL